MVTFVVNYLNTKAIATIKMKKKLMFLALAAMGLASCSGGLKSSGGFKKGNNGLWYNIVVDMSGPGIKPGDFVSLNMTLKTDADSVISSTYENGLSIMQIVQKPHSKGDVTNGIQMPGYLDIFNETAGIQLLSEGDSAVIKINIDSAIEGGPRPMGIPGKYAIYLVKVVKVIAKGNLSDQVLLGRAQAYEKTVYDAARKAEPTLIRNYIDKNKLKVSQTPDSLFYLITKEGSGPKPATGDTAVINYTVKYVINSKLLETNVKAEAQKAKMQTQPRNPYKPIRLPIGFKGMIPGMGESIQLLNKGAKGTFVLPSKLAYGEQGYPGGQIPPFTPLVFDVELVDIVHPNSK